MSVESITDFPLVKTCTCGILDYVASLLIAVDSVMKSISNSSWRNKICKQVIEYKVKSSIKKLDRIRDKVLSKLNICPIIFNRFG